MNVAVSGASGLVGAALLSALVAGGHRVIPLVRRAPRPGEDVLRWDPSTGAIMPAGPSVADAVVHLAGDSIMGLRWTTEKSGQLFASPEAAEGMTAFVEKRKPRWAE